jgi:adenylate kinase
VCGGDLYQRQDDTEEMVRKRLEVFDRVTSPITEYYRLREIVVGISVLGSVAEVRALDGGSA